MVIDEFIDMYTPIELEKQIKGKDDSEALRKAMMSKLTDQI